MALRAITRQISIYNQGETTDVKAELVDDSPFHLHGSLQDPQDTYYEGDHFELDIVIPNDLSSAQSEGRVPVIGLRISLQSFLSGPEPDEPRDVEIAKQFASSCQSFEDTART
ncbi:hypothetical protein DFH94DRAFT_691875 [Russula ochroleuca]|uniref:Uncharacterized protein n=1 Tax=Russula ochroleuca TaxID=152965 RepID=A0A9P5MWV7_9AGAM|nr:hypothetical protein DFH94DRAFT_691875 [Russula ochroleuca]